MAVLIFMQRIKQSAVQRTSLLILLIMTILIATPVIAIAATPTSLPGSGAKITVADSDILTDVQNAESSDSVTSLTNSAKIAGNSLVKFLRTVGVIMIVITLVLIGYGLWFSPSVKSLVDMKGRLGALVVGIIVAFMAEQIAGTILMWLGYKTGG